MGLNYETKTTLPWLALHLLHIITAIIIIAPSATHCLVLALPSIAVNARSLTILPSSHSHDHGFMTRDPDVSIANVNTAEVKVGFHYPSSRPEFTGRVDGPRTRVHFLTPVNSGCELG